MKAIICFGILFVSSLAFADNISCSNAKQDFSYTERTSNGGAAMDTGSIRYKGLTQVMTNPLTGSLDIKLSYSVVMSQDGAKQVVAALASGNVSTGGQTQSFSEWVICDEQKFKQCSNCP